MRDVDTSSDRGWLWRQAPPTEEAEACGLRTVRSDIFARI